MSLNDNSLANHTTPPLTYHDGIDGAQSTPEYYNDILHISNTDGPDTDDGDAFLAKVPGYVDVFKVGSVNGGPVPERNVLRGAAEIMEEVYGPFKKALDRNSQEGWKKLMKEDKFSARQVLRRSSFDDKLLDNYISSVPATVPNGDCWVCIEGGSEVIIKAMQIQLSITPQLQKRVTAISIDHSADSSDLGMLIHVAGEVSPTPVLDRLSFAQKEAIRALKYDTSCMIAIRFKTNWWKRAGIVCGEAATDLPIGLCVYPSYNINDGVGKPVVLLSTSTNHAWVLGALNSAWRGVYQFLQKYEREEGPLRGFWKAKIKALILEFDKPGGLDVLDVLGSNRAHTVVAVAILPMARGSVDIGRSFGGYEAFLGDELLMLIHSHGFLDGVVLFGKVLGWSAMSIEF
ncbi:hypothetical protein BKA61DRAFT_648320 [Leptodontidium sp. MPI-SDFR-AT-0119]|nr:hypothetical protein BKA61DRAFT_648320 [Leptodontidium sp. MPI-SDFR-AT-0119]